MSVGKVGKGEMRLKPKIHESVFIAEGARIYGDVEIGEGSSVWFNAVIRGDEGKVTIGKNTNIQDNTVIHSDMMFPLEIGDNVTIGHGAVLRSCKIGNNCMVGMNSTIMTNSTLGENTIIGANSFVPYNKEIPPQSLATGLPARVVRDITDKELGYGALAVKIYGQLVERYSQQMIVGHDHDASKD
ncbi:MAG: gamma carbonic anhydrase family protein [Thermodesulfobacteriota bacterium]|nr:gamma carbonic anhydrase family protein [Thermodesulfobacteriota bacterium]